MDILTDNYIWAIVAIVVILMTIIGYIAEKTNFGKKEFSKKKNDKKVEEQKKEIRMEQKKEESDVAIENKPTIEKSVEAFASPNEIIKSTKKESEERVQFSDPMKDDMNVASETLKMPYGEAKEDVLAIEEDLNAPFGETASYTMSDENSFDASEDLNVPFGDYGIPTEPLEEDLNAPLSDDLYNNSYDVPKEDLSVPFGNSAEMSDKEEFNLNLPDIDSIKEDVSTTISSENDDDDIWKF